MDKQTSKQMLSHLSSLRADSLTQELSERTLDFFSDTERLKQIAAQRAAANAEQAQGFLFEQLEVCKFNLDALQKGSSLVAKTTDVLGEVNNPAADIRILNKLGSIMKSYQAKSRLKASETAFDLAKEQYNDVHLVGDAEQYGRVKELMGRRASTSSINSSQYKNAIPRFDKGIQKDGVGSGGTTRAEAINNTKSHVADRTATTMNMQAISNEMHQAGIKAGSVGALVGGGISLLSSAHKLFKGETDKKELVLDTVYASASSFGRSYATAAASKAIPHMLTSVGLSQTVIKSLVRSNAHVAIAAGVIQSSVSIGKYLKGDIDFDEMMTEVSSTAMTGASAFYYGALGQALIPIPVVGAFVGSTVGYFIGSILHQSGMISLGESSIVKVARERRERVEAMCCDAIVRMQQAKLDIREQTNKFCAEQATLIHNSITGMDAALVSWDGEAFIKSLHELNATFSSALPFHDFDSFKDFMDDDSLVLKL